MIKNEIFVGLAKVFMFWKLFLCDLYIFLLFQQRPLKQSFCRSLRRDFHWKCFILTLLILGCLSAITWCRLTVVTRVYVHYYDIPLTKAQRSAQISPCEDGYIYIPIAFVVMLYLVYLVECWHCHTRIELHYKVDINTVYDRIRAMREAMPIVWWKAVCYHYVRRTRQVTRYRNGDAFTTTQVYYERVNSHTSSSAFDFSACGIKDISKSLGNLEGYPATKIRLSKGFSFATVEAENEFEDQRSNFFQEYERMDDYMETREGLDLLNINTFKEYIIAFADNDNLPWYVSHKAFWFASLFLLSWPIRVLIEFKTAYVHYHVHKLFGVNYVDSSFCPGQISRVSTMGSSDLEMTISNNYTIVPSYSEALLMEVCTPNSAQDIHGNITFSHTTIPRSHSNMSSASFLISNNRLSNGHAHVIVGQVGDLAYIIQNGAAQNGVLPNGPIFLPPPEIEHFDRTPSIRYRRRRRKRKRRQTNEITGDDTTLNGSDGDVSMSRSQSAVLPSSPESTTAVVSPAEPRNDDTALDVPEPSGNQAPDPARPAQSPVTCDQTQGLPRVQSVPSDQSMMASAGVTDRQTQTAVGDSTTPANDTADSSNQGIVASTSMPASLGTSTVQDPPPNYEEALHMRIAEPARTHDIARWPPQALPGSARRFRCLETSL